MVMAELKGLLKTYKGLISDERLKVRQEERIACDVGQVRLLFWIPEEYVLVYHVEEEGLVHAVPLTIWTELTTTTLRIRISSIDGYKVLSPLPFCVYLRKEILEEESIPIYVVRKDTVEKVLKAVDRSPLGSGVYREFVELVWKRYSGLTLGSILATHIQREGG